MTHMRSPDCEELAGKAASGAKPDAKALEAEAPPHGGGAADGGDAVGDASHQPGDDAPVVLWDEVKAPEAGEIKPADKNLPADPSVH